MNQPPEEDAGHAQGLKTPPEQGATTWASAQLRDQIQRSGAAPEAGQPYSKQVREAGGPPVADLEAESARTAADHGHGLPTRQQITGAAGHAKAAARRADEHTRAARSVDCECQARAGTPCGPSGDHLARYLRATQAGALTRDALKDVITELDVIAPRALIRPSERVVAAIEAGKTTGQAGPRQIDTGMTPDMPGGQVDEPIPAAEWMCILPGYREAPPSNPRVERELEAGS